MQIEIQLSTKKQNKKYLIALILCLFYLLFSIFTYKDYGITADEEIEYKSSKVLAQYLLTGETPDDPGIETRHLPENSIYFRLHTALMTLLNPQNYYEWYHLMNMLVFLPFLLAIFFFFTARFGLLPGLIAFFAFFFTPRLTGDVPANPKDVPFALVYFLALIHIFFGKKGNVLYAAIAGAFVGLSIAMRTIGAGLLILFLFANLPDFRKKATFTPFFKKIIFCVFFAFLLLLVVLPFFKVNFPNSIITLFSEAAEFSNWDKTKLFFGEFLTKNQRPLMYLPVWIVITVPIYQLLGILFSVYFLIIEFKSKRLGFVTFLWVALLLNLSAYAVIRPNIYNAWRHFQFLSPIIISLSLYGIFNFWSGHVLFWNVTAKYRVRKAVAIIFLIFFAKAVYDFATLYPYHYIYFNEIAGGLKGAQGKFELDYWGASYKSATEWLRQNEQFHEKKVFTCNVPYSVQYFAQGKFKLVAKKDEADLIICDYDESIKTNIGAGLETIYVIERQGVVLNYIFSKT